MQVFLLVVFGLALSWPILSVLDKSPVAWLGMRYFLGLWAAVVGVLFLISRSVASDRPSKSDPTRSEE